jgi:LmbE family N-acetylglucosaminyl deacetylase
MRRSDEGPDGPVWLGGHVRVLAIGAHPDDVELGCGGALLAHRCRGDEVSILVMTTGEQGPQAARSRVHEQEDAASRLDARLCWGNFDDGAVPDDRRTIDVIEAAIRDVGADVVYTHASRDTHQDHRATALSTLAAARRSTRVLMYESPTSLGFMPTVYVDVASYLEQKLALLRSHLSQVLKNGLVDLEAVEAQARFRGFAARVHHAEAFETERFLWDLGPSCSRGPIDLTRVRTLEEV